MTKPANPAAEPSPSEAGLPGAAQPVNELHDDPLSRPLTMAGKGPAVQRPELGSLASRTALSVSRSADDAAGVETPSVFNPATAALANPYIWVMAGSVVFLLAYLFPPGAYSRLLGDRNHMFLDPQLLAFCGGCIVMTLIGLGLSKPRNRVDLAWQPLKSPLDGSPLTEWLLVVGLIVLNLGSVVVFERYGGMGAFAAGLNDGSMAKSLRTMSEDAGGKLWLAMIMPSSIFAPVVMQICRSKPPRSIWRWALWIFAITFLVAAGVAGKRNYLARPLFAALLVMLVWPWSRKFTFGKAVGLMATAGVAVLGLFLVYAKLRTQGWEADDGLRDVVRYVLAPYNVSTLIIRDQLVLPGSGQGYFWLTMFWEFPVLTQLFDLTAVHDRWVGEAAPFGVFQRGPILMEYGITSGTSIPAFACSYVDFGWLGILPFLPAAYLGGLFWRSFRRGHLVGLIYYPIFAWACVEWRANMLFPSTIVSYAILFHVVLLVLRALESVPRRAS